MDHEPRSAPDPVVRQHRPRADHPQVRVDYEPAVELQEQMLAVRVDAPHLTAGEPLGPVGVARRAELLRDTPLEHRTDPAGGVRDRVSLRH